MNVKTFLYLFITEYIFQKLLMPDNMEIKIKTFHIIYYKTYQGKDTCNTVISCIIKRGDQKILRIELFDLKLGTRCLHKDIE